MVDRVQTRATTALNIILYVSRARDTYNIVLSAVVARLYTVQAAPSMCT